LGFESGSTAMNLLSLASDDGIIFSL